MSNIYYLGAKKSCSLLENGVSFTKKKKESAQSVISLAGERSSVWTIMGA